MIATEELAAATTTVAACAALGVSRASIYARRRPEVEGPPRPRPTPPRALAAAERSTVLDVLNSERFANRAPAEVYATLLDENTYHCSTRTMYRILAANSQVRERRDQLRHPAYAKPELLATGPNQLWSWDITKLRGPAKSSHFALYVILDVFSRYVVGWLVATAESAVLAEELIAKTCEKERIVPGQLTLHADRGSSMKSKPVAFLLTDLGVTKTHSRPHVSDDNPYVEGIFKTVKYCPEFPDRFGSIEDARAFCLTFFPWYNFEHRHSGIAMLTPDAVHHGRAEQVLEQRQSALAAAYAAHPERFVHGAPTTPSVPTEVWINRPACANQPADGSGFGGLGAGSAAVARGPGTEIARSDGGASPVPGPPKPVPSAAHEVVP
jgi:transposase InsO family protein